MNGYDDKLVDAIQVIVNDAVDKAGYDKTIQCSIIKCIDKTIGEYKVKYQDSTFFAYSQDVDSRFTTGTNVWVLIPRNDMSLTKTILGSVSNLGEDYGQDTELENKYEIIGDNCIQGNGTFNFCSYSTITQEIYNRDKNINSVGLNVRSVESYLKESSSILCGATFQTSLPQEQKFKGNYGIIFELDFKDNATNSITTKRYVIDINSMTGEPYNFIKPSRQYSIFDIDNINFVEVNKIYTFIKDFPHQVPNKPADIFISNFELYGCNEINAEMLAGEFLTFITPQGTYFDNTSLDTDSREIKAQVKVKGEIVNPESQQLYYYWFVENLGISIDNPYYNPVGGEGWKCLNDYSVIQGTEENPEVMDWVSATNTIEVFKKDTPAKYTRYKCVVLYGKIQLSREIIITNYDSKYDITIESDKGDRFYFDIGYPNLTCKINDKEFNKAQGYAYIWAEMDTYGNFTTLPNTDDKNKEYNNTVAAYNTLLEKVENGTALKTQSQMLLNQYLTIMNKYDKIIRVEDNRIFKLPVNEIDKFKTYKCAVYKDGIYIGTASITLSNNMMLDDSYSLVLNNATQVFKYNEQGIAPTSSSLDNPYIIPQLSFTIYDGYGNPFDEEVAEQCNIKWIVPRNNTMLSIPEIYNGNISDDSNNDNIIYEGMTKFNYTIAEKYNLVKTNNTIQLMVNYKGYTMLTETKLTFTKEGEPGTNGTEFLCRIVPNCDSSVAPINPMIITDAGGNNRLNFTPRDSKKWFKVELWHNGELIFNSPIAGLTSENKQITSMQWSVLKNKYSGTISDLTHLTVTANGDFTYGGYTDNSPANIIKCSFRYDGIDYYCTLPIITSKIYTNKNTITLKDYSGFKFAIYASDGRQPLYDNVNPFELIVTEQINGNTEDISTIQLADYKLDYNWGVLGSVYRFENSTGKFQSQIGIQETTVNTTMANQKFYKPLDDYNGECLTNAIKCLVTNHKTGKVIAEIHIPIHLMLNRYGLASLNGWDGNSIQINSEGGYILSPQIGAGKKESDNSFTGMLMGIVKEPNRITEDNGLLAYKNGTRTAFIDAETGTAIFGRKAVYQGNSGTYNKLGGQIIIDSSSDKAMLYSSKYWKNYNEKGLPISYSEANRSGNAVNNNNTGNHNQYINDTSLGMLIDLDTPRIEWGNKNFIVDDKGHLTARGGGSIAGWNIDDYKIASTDSNKTGMSSIYTVGAQGVTQWRVKVPKAINQNGEIDKAIAFWAGGIGTNGKFHVSHDGYVRAQELTVGSGSNANNLIYIGKSSIDGTQSSIYTFNKNSFNADAAGFYLGSDGFGLGKTFSDETSTFSNFQVKADGSFVARSGYIGGGRKGWTIKDTSIYNTKDEISKNVNGVFIGTNGIGLGSTNDYKSVTGKTEVDIHSRFEVTSSGILYAKDGYFDGTISSIKGKIGGWTIAANKLYTDNLHIVSNDNGASKIYSGSKSIFSSNADGFYLSTDGIKLGTYFSVNNKGVLISTRGKIGGWDIQDHTLSSTTTNVGTVTIGDGTQTYAFRSKGSGEFWIKYDGSFSANSGTIAGWKVNESTITGGNVAFNKNGDLSGKNWYINNDGSTKFGNLTITATGDITANGGNFNNVTVSGAITATSGKIAGYTISGDTLYGSQVGMDAEAGGDYAFWAGAAKGNSVNAPFRVGHDGSLVASNATINGTINAGSGTIGGWTLTDYKLQWTNGSKVVAVQIPDYAYQPGSTTKWVFAAGSTNSSGTLGDCEFRVDKDGNLHATKATIEGKITASSGKIGNWTISGSSLSGGTLKTSGWEIKENYIKSVVGDSSIFADGRIGFYGNHRIVGDSHVIINSQQGKGLIVGDGMKNPSDGKVEIYASSASYIHLNSPSNKIEINAGKIKIGRGSNASRDTYNKQFKIPINGKNYCFDFYHGFCVDCWID